MTKKGGVVNNPGHNGNGNLVIQALCYLVTLFRLILLTFKSALSLLKHFRQEDSKVRQTIPGQGALPRTRVICLPTGELPMQTVFSNTALARPLSLIKADFGVGTMHLYTNTPDIDPGAATTQFTAPTYDGYAASDTFTFLGPYDDDSGSKKIMTPGVLFENVGTGPDETITGVLVTFADDSGLWYAQTFDTPVPLAEGHAITIVSEMILPGFLGNNEVIP